MENRFSKENILKKLYIPRESPRIIRFLLSIFYLGFLFAAIGWTTLFLILKFDSILFGLILILFVILEAWFMYIAFFLYYRLKVKNIKLKIKDLKNSVKFVFIADMHIGKEFNAMNRKRLKLMVKKLNELNSDLIVFGGDFVSKEYKMDLLNELKEIKAKYKIGVYGNHDALYLKEKKHELFPAEGVKKLKSLDVQILNNEGIEINLNNESLFFGGINDLYTVDFNIVDAFKNAPSHSKKILLSHNPDVIDFVEESDRIDLILSGHTHAGQILLPVIGLLLPMPVKYQWLTRGLFQINKFTQLFLSQGVGYTGSRIRIGTECEICVIELIPE